MPQSADTSRKLAYLQAVVSSMPQGIGVFDENLRLRVWNRGFVNILNLPVDAIREGVHFSELIRIPARRGEYGPGDAEEVVSGLTTQAAKFERHSYERSSPHGQTHLVQNEPLWIDGQLAGFVTTYTDITERRTSAEREQLAQKVYTHTPAGIIFTDEAHRILTINPATTQMTGYESFELIGQTVFGLINLEHDQSQEVFQEEVAQRGSWSGELNVTRKNGDSFPAGTRVNRVDDPQSGMPAHYVWILADITERKQTEERMRHIAQHDALTGLPNRLALLINGAHSLLAYCGLKAGYEYVHEAVADPALRHLANRLMREEAAPTITPAPGQDLEAYADALITRFANPSLNHRLIQIAMDGSQKIPQRWLQTLKHNAEQGRQCPAILQGISAWIHHLSGANGPVDDPLAERLTTMVARADAPAKAITEIFDEGGPLGGIWSPQPQEIAILALA